MKILKNSLKIDFNIRESLQKSLSRPQIIRVGRVTGNETFSFFWPNWKPIYVTTCFQDRVPDDTYLVFHVSSVRYFCIKQGL